MHHHSSFVFFLPIHPSALQVALPWGRGMLAPGPAASATGDWTDWTGTWGWSPGTRHPILQLRTGMKNSQRCRDCLIKARGGPYVDARLISQARKVLGWGEQDASAATLSVTLGCAAASPAPLRSAEHLAGTSRAPPSRLASTPLTLSAGSSLSVFFTKTKLSSCLHRLHSWLSRFICNHITHCSDH